MVYTVIFVLGLVIGMTTNVWIKDRSIEQNKINKIEMKKEIERDIKNGYRPDIKKYKQKYKME